MLEDMKRLFNPLTPLPERLAIARVWSMIMCRVRQRRACVDPSEIKFDGDQIKRVAEEMSEYISNLMRGAYA